MRKASSRTLLLDVNVLLALAWPHHPFHNLARNRLEAHAGRWATCALTELGFLRLSLNPGIVHLRLTPAEAVDMLTAMVADRRHVYLEPLPSPAATSYQALFKQILGYRQVTDVYLLGLAGETKATIVTFDSRMKELAHGPGRVEVLAM
jgi:toxin-antitoxin system PIN domain toxin